MNTEESAHFDELVEFLLDAASAEELAALLRALLTPAELREIPNRLKITQLLRQGMPQRDIAQRLGVGIGTVTRGSKALPDIEKLLDAYDESQKA